MLDNDLLFQNRNKDYGAFQIRKKYKITVIISLLCVLFFVGVLVIIPIVVNMKQQYNEDFLMKTNIAAVELMPLDDLDEPKREELKPLKSKELLLSISKPSPDSISRTDTANGDSRANKLAKSDNPGISDGDGGDDDVRLHGEALFSCGGDQTAFRNWFYQNFRYPDSLKAKKIDGKIVIQFIVDKRGLIDSVKIVNRVYPALDNEAKRIILSAPRWSPCVIDGRPVKQLYLFPIYILSRNR
jgi:periplasmic protein TonB